MTNHRLPANVEKYAETPIFSEDTIPEKLLKLHDTKPGVWGRIVIIEGALDYFIPGPPEACTRLTQGVFGIIRPAELHRVIPVGSVRFKVEFLKLMKPEA